MWNREWALPRPESCLFTRKNAARYPDGSAAATSPSCVTGEGKLRARPKTNSVEAPLRCTVRIVERFHRERFKIWQRIVVVIGALMATGGFILYLLNVPGAGWVQFVGVILALGFSSGVRKAFRDLFIWSDSPK